MHASEPRPGRVTKAAHGQRWRGSESLHRNRGVGQHGQRLEVLWILGENDTSRALGERDDDRIDGGATASAGPQSSGAAGDGLVDCFHITHPQKSFLVKVPARIAPERLREDDRRDNWRPEAGSPKPAEPFSRGNAALGQPAQAAYPVGPGEGPWALWYRGHYGLNASLFASANSR